MVRRTSRKRRAMHKEHDVPAFGALLHAHCGQRRRSDAVASLTTTHVAPYTARHHGSPSRRLRAWGGVAQLVRAAESYSACRGFESLSRYHSAPSLSGGKMVSSDRRRQSAGNLDLGDLPAGALCTVTVLNKPQCRPLCRCEATGTIISGTDPGSSRQGRCGHESRAHAAQRPCRMGPGADGGSRQSRLWA